MEVNVAAAANSAQAGGNSASVEDGRKANTWEVRIKPTVRAMAFDFSGGKGATGL